MLNNLSFAENCYNLLKQIPKGRVTTYKIIANQLGKKSYRAVGKIIGANPNAPQVPCHRVVKSNGDISGYAFGVDKKIALLEEEGVRIIGDKVQDFEKIIYRF